MLTFLSLLQVLHCDASYSLQSSTSSLSWPSPLAPWPSEASTWQYIHSASTGYCGEVPHKHTAPRSHIRNFGGCATHALTPATAWHLFSRAAKPPAENKHEDSQMFQPWVDTEGWTTLNPLLEREVRQKQTYYIRACMLEVTPKLRAQSWTSTGSSYLGEWRSSESSGRARLHSISIAPGQHAFTYRLFRHLPARFLFWAWLRFQKAPASSLPAF